MPTEPSPKHAIAFVDGQNLFHAAREAYGYTYPNYDPTKLAMRICQNRGWNLKQTRFYAGVPAATDNPLWHSFWIAKLGTMGHQGMHVFSRPLRYRKKTVALPGGAEHSFFVGEEKGIDVRMAIDVIRLAIRKEYDVALIFSQDQDLSEVADEVRVIAREQNRWVKLASAFPLSPTASNPRGINKTDWIPIDRAVYDACLDPRDYRPKGDR